MDQEKWIEMDQLFESVFIKKIIENIFSYTYAFALFPFVSAQAFFYLSIS